MGAQKLGRSFSEIEKQVEQQQSKQESALAQHIDAGKGKEDQVQSKLVCCTIRKVRDVR